MLPQILPKSKFDEFVGSLSADNRVVAPMAKGPAFAFQEVQIPEDQAAIRMDYDLSILPPKKFLMPQRETLLSFGGRGPENVQTQVQAKPTVILGVQPMDLHAIATLDAAMAKDPADPYYLAKRAVTKIVGLNVAQYANDYQFMADMDTLDAPASGWDLFLTDLGDRWFVEVGSEAGQAMITKCSGFSPAKSEDHAAKVAFDKAKAAACSKRLPYDARYLPELLANSYDSLLWNAVARRCFSCGSCTNVCPTCYCFDVQDKLGLDAASGERVRSWDSCQLRVFAEVAGGENFREHADSRLRHRVFRKGKFILERTGKPGCVGCGRCSTHCVAGISILETFQQIADEAAAEI